MRNIYLTLIFLLSISVNAQKYSFDFLTKYESKSIDSKQMGSQNIVNYFNSDNFDYYLRLFKSETDFIALLFDIKSNQTHKFNVTEQKKNGDIFFNFEYFGTRKMSNRDALKNYRFEVAYFSTDSINLKIFTSQRAKKPIREYNLKLKKANKNLFPIARIAFMHPLETAVQINIDKDVIIEKAVEKCKESRCLCEISLAEYKNIDLVLEIPQNKNYINSW